MSNSNLKFCSVTGQGRYKVGCTGQTVVLFRDGAELCRFRDLTYAYKAVFAPDGGTFAVKSTAGWLAFYSVDPPELIKKFRFSKVDGGQDGGCSFSPDGSLFYNIECHKDSTKTLLSVYRTDDFTLVKRFFEDDELLCLDDIVYDPVKGDFLMLGFYRNNYGEAYRGSPDNEYRLMRFSGTEITDVVVIPEERYDVMAKEGLSVCIHPAE